MQDTKVLTSGEVAEVLGKTPQRVRQVAAAGGFPGAFKWGRDWVIPRSGLQHYQRTAKQRRRKRDQSEGQEKTAERP